MRKFDPTTTTTTKKNYLRYWNFRFDFMMTCISQHTQDVLNLSYEYDYDLITEFPFALVLSCTFTESVT